MKVIPNRVYRHFKGNYYYVENIAYDSENDEKMVVYRPLYDSDKNLFVRRESMFIEEIGERKDNITNQKYRFELDDNIKSNYKK